MIELQEMSPGNVQQTFGGDTLNTAIYMTRIATGLPVAVDYVTAVGQDPFSEGMVNFWEKENVGSSLVQRIEGKRPGLYYIQLMKAVKDTSTIGGVTLRPEGVLNIREVTIY